MLKKYTFQNWGNGFPYHSSTVVSAAPVVPHVPIRYLPEVLPLTRFNDELNPDPACDVRVGIDSTITRQ